MTKSTAKEITKDMTETTAKEKSVDNMIANIEKGIKKIEEHEKVLDESGKELEKVRAELKPQKTQPTQNQVKKEEPQTALTVKELEALGSKLSSIIKQITLTNYGIDATMMIKEVDPAYSVFSLRRLMGAIFEQNQFLIEELDTIGSILSMNGSREDIEATREII